MRKAWFARAVPRGAQCQLCEQQCVLDERQSGPCGVRLCLDGEVVTRATDRLERVAIRRVESLGLFHVLPGAAALAVGIEVAGMGAAEIARLKDQLRAAYDNLDKLEAALGASAGPAKPLRRGQRADRRATAST